MFNKDKRLDSTRECPEIAKTLRIRDQQREWQPDPSFLAKCEFTNKGKALYDLRNKQSEERQKPFKHQDDEYYYIIHPDHIKKYLKLQCPDCQFPGNSNNGGNNNNGGNGNKGGNGSGGQGDFGSNNGGKKKGSGSGDAYGNVNERKLIIYHDVDKSEPFPHELKVVHEFANVTSNSLSEKKTTDDDKQVAKSSFSQNAGNPLLALNSQGSTNNAMTFDNLEDNNAKGLANFFAGKRFKGGKHDEMRFEEQPANFNNLNYLSNVNVANFIRKTAAPPATETSGSDGQQFQQQSQNNFNQPIQRRPMVLNVDQKRIDKIFKDNGNSARYNAYPLPENALPISESTGIPGNFVLDKNVNRDKAAPQYILMPDENAYFPEMRKGPGQPNAVFPSRFLEKNSETAFASNPSFDNSRFSQIQSENSGSNPLPSDQILNSFAPVSYFNKGIWWQRRLEGSDCFDCHKYL